MTNVLPWYAGLVVWIIMGVAVGILAAAMHDPVSGGKNGDRVDAIDANHGSCWVTLARLATTTRLTITSAPAASRRSGSTEAGHIGAADDATVDDQPAASSVAASAAITSASAIACTIGSTPSMQAPCHRV